MITTPRADIVAELATVQAVSQSVVDRLAPRRLSVREISAAFRPTDMPGVVAPTARGRKLLIDGAVAEMMAVAATGDVAVAFREKVLNKTPAGQALVRKYNENQKAILAAATNDPDLNSSFATLWFESQPLAKAMIAAADGKPGQTTKYTASRHGRVVELIAGFRTATSNQRFRQALDEVEVMLAPFAGLSAKAAVDKLNTL